VIFGILLILVGGFFLLRTYYPSIDTDRLWPIILVVIGAVFVIGALRPGSGPDEG
jgi:predicted anti-sigma-YlaC factor YlaD